MSSYRLRGSLGDSWGDADYESDGAASVQSASDLGSDVGSESEFIDETVQSYEHEDLATPLPTRAIRDPSRNPQGTPVKTPANSVMSRQSQSPRTTPRSHGRSAKSTPGSEPSLIMPSMYGSPESFSSGSPLRNSHVRARKPMQSTRLQPGSAYSSPRQPSRRSSAKVPPPPPEERPNLWHYINLFCNYTIWPLLRYALGIVGYAADLVKPLIAVGVVLWMLICLFASTSNLIESKLQAIFTPICMLPGSSYILPFCSSPAYETNEPAFEEVVKLQSTFEDILSDTKDMYSLPYAMRYSENSIRDLKILVKFSNLPSKAQLEVQFEDFIATAKQASQDLTRYNSRIGNTMDKVIATNRWTMSVLEGIADKRASTGSLSRLMGALNPFASFSSPTSLQQQIFDQYIKHVAQNRKDIEELMATATALLSLLDRLEYQLEEMASQAAQDGVSVNKKRDELLGQLWTILGGNRSKKKEAERQLSLLKDVMSYRKVAVMHVSSTLLRLQDIQNGLENLRDGVAAPEVLGMRDEVPLSYHVDVIEKAVERLKVARGENLALEKKNLAGLINRDEDGQGKLPGGGGGDMPTVYAGAAGP